MTVVLSGNTEWAKGLGIVIYDDGVSLIIEIEDTPAVQIPDDCSVYLVVNGEYVPITEVGHV